MPKSSKFYVEQDFLGTVTLINRKGSDEIDFDGFIVQKTGRGVTEKDFVSCQKVINPSKTYVRGVNCSVTECECERSVCKIADFCGRETPVKSITIMSDEPFVKSSFVATLKKRDFEFDKYDLNDATLRKFIRKRKL